MFLLITNCDIVSASIITQQISYQNAVFNNLKLRQIAPPNKFFVNLKYVIVLKHAKSSSAF